MHLSADGVITDKQIKEPMCLLVAQQHQTLGRGIAPPTVGFHRDGFDIEEHEMPTGGQVPENPAQSSQNCRSLWVLAEQLALHPPEAHIVFLATGAIVRAL